MGLINLNIIVIKPRCNWVTSMPFQAREFRNALGRFATGIAVVTTADSNGNRFGLTVNSFNSVSLEPPLVLFSLDKKNNGLASFQNSGCFAVNVLSSTQQSLSDHFATSKDDKFATIEHDYLSSSAPILRNCLAVFDCKTVFQYEGGDHLIFVGEVIDIATNEGDALLYYRGQYTSLKT